MRKVKRDPRTGELPLFHLPAEPPAPPLPPAIRSPGFTRLGFRARRIWKRRWVRRVAFTVLPAATAIALAVGLAMNPTVRGIVADTGSAIVASLSDRPEFAIKGYRITGGSPSLRALIDAAVALPPNASTLNFDVANVRRLVEGLPAVRTSSVVLDPRGILRIRLTERHARALWRDARDGLWRIDDEGVRLGRAFTRGAYPLLPLILGEGGDAAVAEALAILAAAPKLIPRLRALVRVGRRRWNIVLDRGLTIMLPEQGAPDAMSHVMAWQYGGEDVLGRGISVIDMRLPDRPTVRLLPEALKTLKQRKSNPDGREEDT